MNLVSTAYMYCETGGIAMGSPLGPTLANIYGLFKISNNFSFSIK